MLSVKPHDRPVEGHVDLDRERARIVDLLERLDDRAEKVELLAAALRTAGSEPNCADLEDEPRLHDLGHVRGRLRRRHPPAREVPTTNVPLPTRASTSPWAASTPTAWRTVGRLTPNSAASARSGGSLSPVESAR